MRERIWTCDNSACRREERVPDVSRRPPDSWISVVVYGRDEKTDERGVYCSEGCAQTKLTESASR